MGGRTAGWVGEGMEGWKDGWMDEWVDRLVDRWMETKGMYSGEGNGRFLQNNELLVAKEFI